jgi:MATE family multidrug resistance protein
MESEMAQALDASTELSWWNRPAGGREVLRVAAPLVVSSLSWTVMTFVDRVFLHWVSGAAMAAAFSASVVWFLMICLPLGICAYANTFVSQYFGARQPEQIGVIVWQAVWCALLSAPVLLLAIPLAPSIFGLAGHGPQAFQYEVDYFQILCIGGPGMLVAQAAASFYSGRGETWVVMWIDGAFAVLNVVLDYFWIFGYAGFPEWGVAGAAWATVVSLWLKAGVYLLLMLHRRHREQFGTGRGCRLDLHLLGRLLYFGGPSGLQMLLDVMGFTAFILLVARLGPVAAEATTIAFSINSLAFMPIWGLGLGTSILVGQHLGENRDDLAATATYTSLWIAWAYMGVTSVIYVLAPGIFLHGFFAAATTLSPEDQAVERLAIILLRFVAAYSLLDATFMIFVSAIKGAGDTAFVLRVSLVLSALLASLSWLSVEVWEFGVFGSWTLITAWVWIAAITFVVRFRRGKWRSMRVIESPEAGLPEILPAPAAE